MIYIYILYMSKICLSPQNAQRRTGAARISIDHMVHVTLFMDHVQLG